MSASQRRTYFDFNATTPLRPAVRDAMTAALALTGNPSSIHAEGRAARAAVEDARAAVAALAGVAPGRVVFTSGATEGAALALSPALAGTNGAAEAERLVVGATEHPAVRLGHRFADERVEDARVTPDGLIDLDALRARLQARGRAVVAVQLANGETGVVQPIEAVAALVHASDGLLVCDASQAAGRIDLAPAARSADVLLLSAHKLGGPQGAGAVVTLRDGLRFGPPLLRGGGQERGLRAGTENVAALAGFGAAARLAGDRADAGLLAGLRDRMEQRLLAAAPDLVVFGAAAPRLPNTSAFGAPGVDSQTALIALDLAGFAVSTGSACSSGKVSRSAVLEAMGVDDHLRGSMIRVSLGWATTAAEVESFVDAFAGLLQRMRGRAALRAA